MAKCSAIAKSGNPCGGVPIDGSQWCYHHHPDNQGKLHARGRKGGQRGGRGRPRVELSNVKAQLQDLADGVLDGTVDRADASVVGQLLNIILRAISVDLEAREQEELVQRLEALEEAAEVQKTRGMYGELR